MSRSPFRPSLHLLDDVFERTRHLRDGLLPDDHPAVVAALHEHVDLAEGGRLLGEVLARVRAAALLALERRARDRLAHGEEAAEVERGVPPRVVVAVAGGADARGPLL